MVKRISANPRRLILGTATSLVLLIGYGCSPSGPARMDLTGKVTYGGKAVPSGQIYFEPDTSKGNVGPQGSGEIHDGVYETNRGFGATSGPHRVRIIAYEGKSSSVNEGALQPLAKLLAEYQTTVDIPKGARTLDFDIPAKKP